MLQRHSGGTGLSVCEGWENAEALAAERRDRREEREDLKRLRAVFQLHQNETMTAEQVFVAFCH